MKKNEVRKLAWLIKTDPKPFLFTQKNGRHTWLIQEGKGYKDLSPTNMTLNSAYWWMQGYLTRYIEEI